MAELTLDLKPGEEILRHIRASFRGAADTTSRSTFLLGSAHVRHKAFEQWRVNADNGEFPTAGPEMVLALTDQRLFVCRTTFWLSRPSEAVGAVHLSHIADVAVVRHGLVISMALADEWRHDRRVRDNARRRVAHVRRHARPRTPSAPALTREQD